MHTSNTYSKLIIYIIFITSLIFTINGKVAIAGNVIYVPVDSNRNYWRGSYRFSEPITVIDRKGEKHILKKAYMKDTLDSTEAGKMGFSRSEADTVFELTTPVSYENREILKKSKDSCYKMYVSICEIERIELLPEKKAYKFFPRNQEKKPFIAKFAYEGRPRYIHGTEDLGQFGKASFKESISSLKRIDIPELPLQEISQKSTSSAIVTEAGGKKHKLDDLRVSTFFYKGEANFKVDTNKIDTIVVTEDSDRGRVKCNVKLKSGDAQDFEWGSGYVGGKEGDWFILIRAKQIASVKFLQFPLGSAGQSLINPISASEANLKGLNRNI